MRLFIAGGCSEHGRNCFLVSGDHISFLVDAGRMKEIPEKPLPELDDDQIRAAGYLFLTHCHTDHTGAIGFLEERGFKGTVIASSATFKNMRPFSSPRIALEDICSRGDEGEICPGLEVMWGRAGHCIGSVWYRFRAEGKTIVFTGDYEEESISYICDHIRGQYADLAVVDCAYGHEKEDAAEHWSMLEELLDELTGKGKPLLFPVPSHGRGFDVIKLLTDRNVPIVMAESLVSEYRDTENREFWLKESFIRSADRFDRRDISAFETDYTAALRRGDSFPEEYRSMGIVVRDTQLVKDKNREIARGVYQKGGRTVLTGKQDPASYARMLLNRREADFRRISVHQNIDEMMRLRDRNDFKCIVPYHCREELSFEEPDIAVLRAGDEITF
ncbi:MAG: MBL fold metallo-hydrolase [Lachnospiraceae bacterium]|nr:MBL fold metallo-hydrolase [Lachnospiraceae bacterium]